ncbi:MAG: hypothetical protein EA356_00030 [Geminicoccaceae bacterium]|nr:MAG: hypothetical protein EA356_00030 [Geminicoccaceae bacterium]
MIPVPSGVRVWLATGATDMRRGMPGLALQVQVQLGRDPHAGDLFVFRGRRGERPSFRLRTGTRDRRVSVAPAVRAASSAARGSAARTLRHGPGRGSA